MLMHNTAPESVVPAHSNAAVRQCWAQTCMKAKLHGCNYDDTRLLSAIFAELQSAREQDFSPEGKCAVHQFWASADLYERQICTAVTVGQDCCQPVSQSSTEPQSMSPVLSNAAVHQSWAGTDL